MEKLRKKDIKKIKPGVALISQFFNFSTRGFGLIEAVVGVALFSTFLVGIIAVAQFSLRLTASAGAELQAVSLFEEGVDAVRGLRDASWASRIAPLALNTDYWLQFNSGVWALTSSPQPFIDGRFDRRIQVSQVLRDTNDDIVSSGGSLDPNTKKITVSVSWFERGATTTQALSAYLTNLFNN